MEPLGSHYAVLLHDPKLRTTMVDEDSRPSPGRGASRTFRRLRVGLARMLIGVAAHVEPSVPVWSTTSRGEALPGH